MPSCPTCGSEYDTVCGMKIHHTKSHGESIAGFETECTWCGETIVKKKESEADGNSFCDHICQGKWTSESREESASCATKEKVSKACAGCGEPIERYESQFYTEDTYCSHQCRGETLYKGDNNPNWKKETATQISYSGDWEEARQEALERAKGCCEHPECGKSDFLDVHHIVPYKMIDDAKRANSLENLLVLCRRHHKQLEPGNWAKKVIV